MKKTIQNLLKSLVIGILLPVLLLWAVLYQAQPDAYGHAAAPPDPTQQTQIHTVPAGQKPPMTRQITLLREQEELTMDLETYLVGVVLAEMPASFHIEALKAQAVAARTFALRRSGEGSCHGLNRICGNPSCCQAYIHQRDYLQGYGDAQNLEKVCQAVYQTAGQVMTYGQELISAAYFSCSGGTTEDARAVWGYDVPYLRSVDSPGEEDAPVFADTVTFTADQFRSVMALYLPQSPDTWFGAVTYTDGGGVENMTIGGVAYRGTTLRALLGLRSTSFTVSVKGDTITFTTSGFGHRVGMSQYGANAMAHSGSDFKQILTHYYTGAQLVQWEGAEQTL